MSALRLYTFSPGLGLPTLGPFAIKLEMALTIAGIPYERRVHDVFATAPKRKIPFVEKDGVRMGDSELILAWLGVDLDGHLSPAERGQGLAFRRLLEEHWHQVEEWELFVHPEGRKTSAATMSGPTPALLRPVLGAYMAWHFRRHLSERGIGRHSPEEIADFGRRDLDALAAHLADRPWFFGDRPTLTDCSAFGLLALAMYGDHPTPALSYARQHPVLRAYVDRCRALTWPEQSASPARASA